MEVSSFKRSGILIILLMTASLTGNLQAFQPEQPAGRLFYGGYLGFEFSHLTTRLEAAPVAGYRIFPRWHAGTGIKYQFYRSRQRDRMFNSHIYGPMAFTDVIAIKDLDEALPFRFLSGALFFHGEVNCFSLPVDHFDAGNQYADRMRFFRPSWLVGGGLRSAPGTGSGMFLLVMMDISGHTTSVYTNPVIRFGFVF
jgi:hypothetical protein